MKHVSDENAAKEIAHAIEFDLRDVPRARALLDGIIKVYGKDGVEKFRAIILDEIKKEYDGDKSDSLFPWTRAAVRTLISGGVLYEQFLGNIGMVIGGVLTAGIQAATSVYTTKLQVNAQEDIVKFQTNQAIAEANAAKALAEAQQAAAVAAMKQKAADPFGLSTASVGGSGMNNMLLIGGIVAAAIFVLPKLRRR